MLLQLLPSPCLLRRGPDALLPRGVLRRGPDVLPPRGVLRRVVCASVTQVQRFSTVNSDSKLPVKWNSLFHELSLAQDPTADVSVVIPQWEQQNRKLIKWEVCRIARELRKFRRYKLALDVYEWICSQDRFGFQSSDAAILLDLVYKVRGLSSAEDKFNCLPEALKDKRTYGSLLSVYANAKEKEKAEGVFETMRKKGYLTECLVYNVIMTMYKNLQEHGSVISLVREMTESNVPLDSFSVNIWITTCAEMGDMGEMERILGLIDADKFAIINWANYTTLATMLLRLGQMDKAVKYMREAESRLIGSDKSAFHCLITLYGQAGMKDDVYRIWRQYTSLFAQPVYFGYRSMLTTLIKLDDIEGAESIYRQWLSSARRHDPKICNVLLSYYNKRGELSKAESCLEEMLSVGGIPSPVTLEILANLHIRQKRVWKALSFLTEAVNTEQPPGKIWRPRLDTVRNFLAVCAKQGDQASMNSLIEMLEELKCLDFPSYKKVVSTYAQTDLHAQRRSAGVNGEPLFSRSTRVNGKPLFPKGVRVNSEPLFSRSARENGRPFFPRSARVNGQPFFSKSAGVNGEPLFSRTARENGEPLFSSTARVNARPYFSRNARVNGETQFSRSATGNGEMQFSRSATGNGKPFYSRTARVNVKPFFSRSPRENGELQFSGSARENGRPFYSRTARVNVKPFFPRSAGENGELQFSGSARQTGRPFYSRTARVNVKPFFSRSARVNGEPQFSRSARENGELQFSRSAREYGKPFYSRTARVNVKPFFPRSARVNGEPYFSGVQG